MNNIKIFRTKNNQTLAQLSESTKLSIGYLNHLEKGSKKNPSKETMEKIASALSKSVQEVFYMESEINDSRSKCDGQSDQRQ